MKKALFRLTCNAGLKLIKDGYRFEFDIITEIPFG